MKLLEKIGLIIILNLSSIVIINAQEKKISDGSTGNLSSFKGINRQDILLKPREDAIQLNNSVFVNPLNPNEALVSNETKSGTTAAIVSFDGNVNWTRRGRDIQIAEIIEVFYYPSSVINLNGTLFSSYSFRRLGTRLGASYDKNNWIIRHIDQRELKMNMAKSFLWVDNSQTSIYKKNLYSTWSVYDASLFPVTNENEGEILFRSSSDDGSTWSEPIFISKETPKRAHFNQEANIKTGPNGEIYVVWTIFDEWPGREKALGFASSIDGGKTFTKPSRIQNNIKGITWFDSSVSPAPGVDTNPHGKDIYANSKPSMAVDISNGPNRGTIYVVWSNIGIPGHNQGNDVSIYIIKSKNKGVTWSNPEKIDKSYNGNVQILPWITCDPITGYLSMIFYDDRNVGGKQLETWVANSKDGGENWSEFKVSDVAFTPRSAGLTKSNFMTQYPGISARGGKVYPVWTDNRTGKALSYFSPYEFVDCLDNYTVSNSISNETDNYSVSNQITATNRILNNSNISYHAGKRIVLKPGFSIKKSKFKAKIKACSNSLRQLKSNINMFDSQLKTNRLESVLEEELKNDVYPNPFKDKITIKSSFTSWSIYNLSNRKIKTGNEKEINTSDILKGIYTLHIALKSGEVVKKKIIKN